MSSRNGDMETMGVRSYEVALDSGEHTPLQAYHLMLGRVSAMECWHEGGTFQVGTAHSFRLLRLLPDADELTLVCTVDVDPENWQAAGPPGAACYVNDYPVLGPV